MLFYFYIVVFMLLHEIKWYEKSTLLSTSTSTSSPFLWGNTITSNLAMYLNNQPRVAEMCSAWDRKMNGVVNVLKGCLFGGYFRHIILTKNDMIPFWILSVRSVVWSVGGVPSSTFKFILFYVGDISFPTFYGLKWYLWEFGYKMNFLTAKKTSLKIAM